jgi:hypothetical protein
VGGGRYEVFGQDGLNSAAILNEGKVVMKAVNFMEKAGFLRHFTILEYK